MSKEDPRRKDIGFDEWYASAIRPILIMQEPEKDNRLFYSHGQLREAWIAGTTPPTVENLMRAISRGWCHADNAHKQMDPRLALAIGAEVFALLSDPSPQKATE